MRTIDRSDPKRVEILRGDGSYFKRGQFGYVVGTNISPLTKKTYEVYLQDRSPGNTRPGELAYLVSKSKGMRGGALWYSAEALRFTKRS